MDEQPSVEHRKIFPTYIGSNELSPFHNFYANKNTVLRRAAGRFFVHDNGDNPTEGYWALRREAALFDVPERPIEICGPDAVPFLERVIARKISDLKPGRGRYVIACTHQGGVFIDGILFRINENCFWFVQPDGELDTWLLAHSADFDVLISDPNSRVLQLQGPKSYEIIHEASKGAVDETLKYFHSNFFNIGGQPVYVSRTGWTGELGYEIYTLGSKTNSQKLWDQLTLVGNSKGMIFSAMQSMNIRRIEAGILDSGSDFDTTMTPFEAGLERFVDFKNKEFIGRDALQSRGSTNLLFGVEAKEIIPMRGDQIFDGTRQVGIITTGAWSPFLKQGIGYVRFEKSADWSGKTLALKSKKSGDTTCKVVDLPFYDQDKRLPRDLPNLNLNQRKP